MNQFELVYRDPETVDSGLYDVMQISKDRSHVVFVARPLILMLWAANVGYNVLIDDSGEVELWTNPERGKPKLDYHAGPQHKDYMLDIPALQDAIEMTRWM